MMVLSLPAMASMPWSEDWDSSLQRARSEGKDLLIFFTGSDWCVWCQRLEAEVLGSSEFQQSVPQDFVLVKLDFPRRRVLPPAVQERNRQLALRYGIEGYPTLVLSDSEGRPYARMGYQPGGPRPFLEQLRSHRSAKEADWALLRQARAARGQERARLLDRFLDRIDERGQLTFFLEEIDEVIRHAEASSPLREKYTLLRELTAIKAEPEAQGSWPLVLNRLRALEERATRAGLVLVAQDALLVQAAINLNALNDRTEARRLLVRARDLDPRSRWGRLAAQVLERL